MNQGFSELPDSHPTDRDRASGFAGERLVEYSLSQRQHSNNSVKNLSLMVCLSEELYTIDRQQLFGLSRR
jgi:hypothetical protein